MITAACRLCKVGVLPAGAEARLSRASACAELLAYAASVTLKLASLKVVTRRLLAYQESLRRSVRGRAPAHSAATTPRDPLLLSALP